VDIAAWLRDLGLEQYEPVFRANEIDARVLRSLTADDLKDLGVSLVGHRRRLLDAIAALGAQSPAAVTAAPHYAPSPADAERRQLTVMFCDLVGSTELSARLDPEDLREVISAYHRAVASVVAGFDGFVAKYMGDGVLVYFGYPRAHEDDAERAVHAGLGIIDAVGRLDVKSVKLHARVGIATGLVVVGDLIGEGSAREQSVVGETPNLAARLQALAKPDAVVIAATTRRLIGSLFECRDLGAVDVKGLAAPVPAWQAVRPSAVVSRFEALRGSALTPMVGRDEEIDLLLRRWARAKTGDGQVVLISGEPGIGKSRLTMTLAELLPAEPHLRLRYFCSPYHQDSALFPFIDQLGREAGFAADDPPAAKLEKLEAFLAHAAQPDEDVALLAGLLSLPVTDSHLLPNFTPQREKNSILEALIRLLGGLARRQPVVMIFEDAHWIDPSSLELLDLVMEQIPNLPVLLIMTFRSEFQPRWTGQPQVTMLTLNRLDRRDRSALIEQITGDKMLPGEIVDQIADRTDGVPLFVEEFTKSVLESGQLREEAGRYVLEGALPPFAIPTTLQASLMARLDRSASVRLVLQTGAAIGREFSYALLRAVSDGPEEELQAALHRSVASELVFQRGMPPDAVYSFKHALVQDAAYATLLRELRQLLHGRIADALLSRGDDKSAAEPEILAHHLQSAGRSAEAITLWREAGERSVRRAADREAIGHFRRALSLLEAQPESVERSRLELMLLSRLSPELMHIYGWSSPEAAEAIERAASLARRIESSAELAPSIANLWLLNHGRGRLDRAEEISGDLFRIARELNDPEILLQAHHSSWPTCSSRGWFAKAKEHIDAALSLYDEALHAHHRHTFIGHDPAVCALSQGAFVQWALGYPTQAVRFEAEALGLGRRLDHLPSMVHSLRTVCEAQVTRRDPATALATATEFLRLSEEHGFAQMRADALVFLGWAMASSGESEEGLARLEEGCEIFHRSGHRWFLSRTLCLMSEGLLASRRSAEGLEQAARALDAAIETGHQAYLPRIHRVRAALLLARGDPGEAAEAALRQSLAAAQEQGAKGPELQAAIALAEHLIERDQQKAARDLLAPVCDWFTEGFDTPDLKDAKALLDALDA
jgi:class 3 adenylate cyclase/predicted ATPase